MPHSRVYGKILSLIEYFNSKYFSEADSHVQTLDIHQSNILDFFIVLVSLLIFILMIIFASMQIIVRHIFNPLGMRVFMVWSITAAQLLFVISVFWGAAICTRNNEHIEISFLKNKIRSTSERLYIVLQYIDTGIIFIFGLILLVGFLYRTLNNWGDTILGYQIIQAGYIDVTISIGLLILLYYSIIDIHDIRGE